MIGEAAGCLVKQGKEIHDGTMPARKVSTIVTAEGSGDRPLGDLEEQHKGEPGGATVLTDTSINLSCNVNISTIRLEAAHFVSLLGGLGPLLLDNVERFLRTGPDGYASGVAEVLRFLPVETFSNNFELASLYKQRYINVSGGTIIVLAKVCVDRNPRWHARAVFARDGKDSLFARPPGHTHSWERSKEGFMRPATDPDDD